MILCLSKHAFPRADLSRMTQSICRERFCPCSVLMLESVTWSSEWNDVARKDDQIFRVEVDLGFLLFEEGFRQYREKVYHILPYNSRY